MQVTVYHVNKTKIRNACTKERKKMVFDRALKFDIIINNTVNIFNIPLINTVSVEISNDLDNHQEILNTVQNILKEIL